MTTETNKKDSFSLLKRKHGAFKKAIFAMFLISTMAMSNGQAEAADTDHFKEIYHIYVGDEYIGYTSNEEVIQDVIQTKEKEASTQYKGLSLDASSSITIVPEQVFKVEKKDQETIKKLKEEIEIQADAYAIQVNDVIVGYVKDAIAYEETINSLKLEYVSQEQLKELNARQHATDSLPPLKENETRILEVSLSAQVSSEAKKVNPKDILTVKQAKSLLMTGVAEKQLYTVQEGDVLGSIAKKHALTNTEMMALNPGVAADTVLKVGQELQVTVNKPYVTVKIVSEKMTTDVIAFEKVTKEDASRLKGDHDVTQAGENGKKQTISQEVAQNGIKVSTTNKEEKILKEAVNEVTTVGTKVIPSRGTGSFVWPANGGYVSSKMGPRWGSYHRGIDIARPSNRTIKAADNGVVTAVGWEGTYGNRVVMDHNNGYKTVYAHLSSMNVKVGQVIGQGSAIGVMGSTGNSTGIHLHFEIQKNGGLVDPLSYLN